MIEKSHRNIIRALYESGMKRQEFDSVNELFKSTDELFELLKSPVVFYRKKQEIVKDLAEMAGMSTHVKNAAVYLAGSGLCPEIDRLKDGFYEYADKQEGVLNATLICARVPDETRAKQVISFLKTNLDKKKVNLSIVKDKSIVGGFIIEAEGVIFDRSMRTMVKQIFIGDN